MNIHLPGQKGKEGRGGCFRKKGRHILRLRGEREDDWSAVAEWAQNLGWDEKGSRGWINNRFEEQEGREQPVTQV